MIPSVLTARGVRSWKMSKFPAVTFLEDEQTYLKRIDMNELQNLPHNYLGVRLQEPAFQLLLQVPMVQTKAFQ